MIIVHIHKIIKTNGSCKKRKCLEYKQNNIAEYSARNNPTEDGRAVSSYVVTLSSQKHCEHTPPKIDSNTFWRKRGRVFSCISWGYLGTPWL
jgi:hypothetical protein